MNHKKKPNYRKLYPTASDAVIEFLKSSERKMEYQSYDMKVERCKVDQEKMTVQFIPSREDSLERLLDENVQFAAMADNTEDIAVRNLMIEQLYIAMKMLNKEELELIYALFYEDRNECEYGSSLNISQQSVNKRKLKTLKKLKKFLEI